METAKDLIPDMIHPLSTAWNQPSRELILMDKDCAMMDQKAFGQLHEYSTSIPSGVYDGKMWKSKGYVNKDIQWFLRWYGPSKDPDKCSTFTKQILLV